MLSSWLDGMRTSLLRAFLYKVYIKISREANKQAGFSKKTVELGIFPAKFR